MKILYFTDLHLTSRQPLRRIDDYQSTQLQKLNRVFSLAKEYGVHMILEGGDLLDKESDSLEFMGSVLCEFLKNKIPYIKVLGNHDVCGYSLPSYRRGFVGMLEKLGAIVVPEAHYGIGDFIFHTVHYTKDIPKSFKIKGGKEKRHIVCMHNMIFPKQDSCHFTYQPLEEFTTNCSLCLLGHWHHPFFTKINGVSFLNPGSLGRLNANESDFIPSVLIIDLETNEVEIISIGEEGSKVFDVPDKAEKASYKYIETKSMDFSGVESAWDVLKRMDLAENVYRECGNRLGQAEELLK